MPTDTPVHRIKAGWSAADIPGLAGRIAVVTGASSGIGYEIARRLAAHGAHVVLACRDANRAAQAASAIRAQSPAASTEARVLDLGSLPSVRRFAAELGDRHGGLDILVNNAGISGGPRRETADGFEAHFGVNYLGHFALTGLLLPALLARPGARVVTMSSGLAAQARINFDDLGSQRAYRMTSAYGQSKLAGLVFAIELGRRARAAGSGLASLAAHPGAARTSLVSGKEAEWGRRRDATETVVRLVSSCLRNQRPRQPSPPSTRPPTPPPTAPATSAHDGTCAATRQPAHSRRPHSARRPQPACGGHHRN